MGSRSRVLVAIFAILALLGAACAQDEDTGAQDGDGETISFSIKIGGVLPLTGALSDFGPAMARGAELAAEVFEDAASEGGHDVTVEVIVEDSQTDPAAGVDAARKLVDTDQVNAIVGGAASSVTLAVAESVTIPGEITECSPASTSGDITDLEDDGFVNRTPPSDEAQAPILSELVVEDLGEDATVNLGARNDAYGTFLIDGVEQQLTDRGVTIGSKTLWNPDAATFDSEANEITSGDPDGWVLIDFPGTWQKMGPALVRTGNWDPAATYSADGLKTSQLPSDPPEGAGQETTEGMKGTAPGGTGAFDELWDERVTDVTRETFDAHTFDCTMLILLAAAAANSSDSADIRDNIQAVSGPEGTQYSLEEIGDALADLAAGEDIDYEGASGPINLDENGDPQTIDAVYEVYRFEGGEMQVVDQVRVEEVPES